MRISTNIRLGLKCLKATNGLAYWSKVEMASFCENKYKYFRLGWKCLKATNGLAYWSKVETASFLWELVQILD